MQGTGIGAVAFCISLFIALFSSPVSAEATERPNLTGIGGMWVLVNNSVPESLAKSGVTQSSIKARIELALRKANIAVREEGAPGPFLYVVVSGGTAGGDVAVYQIDVSLKIPVSIIETQRVTLGCVWDTGAVGATTVDANGASQIYNAIDQIIIEFMNDYLAVNPK